jgi:hypothetical protein
MTACRQGKLSKEEAITVVIPTHKYLEDKQKLARGDEEARKSFLLKGACPPAT